MSGVLLIWAWARSTRDMTSVKFDRLGDIFHTTRPKLCAASADVWKLSVCHFYCQQINERTSGQADKRSNGILECTADNDNNSNDDHDDNDERTMTITFASVKLVNDYTAKACHERGRSRCLPALANKRTTESEMPFWWVYSVRACVLVCVCVRLWADHNDSDNFCNEMPWKWNLCT